MTTLTDRPKLRLIQLALVVSAGAVLAGPPATRPATAGDAPPTLAGATFLTSPGDRWKLSWHDEFAGDALDASKWSVGLPWPGDDGDNRHHNDLYASYIVDHDVVVSGGTLKLLTRREDVTGGNGRVFHYTEGLVTTAKSFRQAYGYWEARVRLPAAAGPGLWPAFWTLSEGWPPEMDICEIWTTDDRSHQGLCYRPGDGGGRHRGERWDEYNAYVPLPTGWTTYGMEWGPGYQIYNINGRVRWRVYGEHVPDDRHYVLLNSGVESGRPPTSATTFPNAFEVDYVRVYERPAGVPVIQNGSFEEDDVRPWVVTGRGTHVGYGARDGGRALRLDGGPSGAEQRVYGLRPGTAYVVTAWVRGLGPGVEVRLGVRDQGGSGGEVMTGVRPEGDGYRQVALEFTTGPEATGATVYCAVPGSAGAVLVDDWRIRAK